MAVGIFLTYMRVPVLVHVEVDLARILWLVSCRSPREGGGQQAGRELEKNEALGGA